MKKSNRSEQSKIEALELDNLLTENYQLKYSKDIKQQYYISVSKNESKSVEQELTEYYDNLYKQYLDHYFYFNDDFNS